jgi:hypothetical protein
MSGSLQLRPAHTWIERIRMTAPGSPQWQLTPPLRFAAIALLCAGVGFLVEGWLSIVLWVAAIVFLILAAARLAKVWRSRPKNTPT